MGALFLVGYIAAVGVATFLLKYVSKDIDAYQMNLMMGIGMLVVSAPAVWIAHRSFRLPTERLPLIAATALLMAVGSVSYVLAIDRLPVAVAAAIATSYVVVVVVLSRLVLHEELTITKVAGLAMTLIGVALLSASS